MQQRVITIVLLIGLFFSLLSLGAGMASWRLPDREQGYAPVQPIDYSHRLHAGELGIDCRFCHWASYRGRYAGIPSTDICMKCHDVVTMTWDRFKAQQPDDQESEVEGRARAEVAKAEEGTDKKKNIDTEQGDTKQDVVKQDADSKQNADKKQGEDSKQELDPAENKLLPLYRSLGLDAAAKPIEGARPQPIRWVRVHNLPDFVYFDHSAHMAVGVTCQRCHGPVESMERVRQFAALSMGWCVTCHQESTKDGIDGRVVNAPTNCAACHY